MLKNNMIIAYRNFIRNKIYSFITIFGLALGIATSFLILIWVGHELSYDRFHEHKDRLYQIVQKGILTQGDIRGNQYIPYALPNIMQEEFPEIEAKFQIRNYPEMLIDYVDKKFYHPVSCVEPELFSMLTVPVLVGNENAVFSNENSIILSESYSNKIFGSENPIGKIITLNSDNHFTVSAIFQDFPANSSISFDVAIPFRFLPESTRNSWSWESNAYVLLHQGTDVNHFREKIKDTIQRHGNGNKNETTIRAITKMHLHNALEEPQALHTVILFSFIAAIVLLLACINYTNLAIALAATRLKEVEIKKMLGANKKSLLIQFYTESILQSFFAFFFALLIMELLLPLFNELIGYQFALNQLSALSYALMIGITFLTGLIAGSYPAAALSSFPSNLGTIGLNRFSANTLFRKILVIFQYSISIALIIIATALYLQIKFVQNKELGYQKEHVICLQANQILTEKYDTFKEELLKRTPILSVSHGSTKLSNIGNVNPVWWEGKQDDERVLFNFYLCDYELPQFFGLEFVAGRSFSQKLDATDEQHYIVNEAAIRLMELDDPIGKRFAMYGQEGEIIGVVKDFHFQPLQEEIRPLLFTVYTQWMGWIFIRVDAHHMQEAIAAIEDVNKAIAPEFPARFSFLDEEYGKMYRHLYEMEEIIKYFAILAFIISALGLFGLVAFIMKQRQKEVAIRKIYGAGVNRLVFHFSRQFAYWIIIANVIAYIIAYFSIQKILQAYAYQVHISFLVYLLPGMAVLLMAMLVVSLQTLKTANSNPAKVLQYE